MKINKYFSIKFSVVLGIVASSCSNNNDQIVDDYSGEEKGLEDEQVMKTIKMNNVTRFECFVGRVTDPNVKRAALDFCIDNNLVDSLQVLLNGELDTETIEYAFNSSLNKRQIDILKLLVESGKLNQFLFLGGFVECISRNWLEGVQYFFASQSGSFVIEQPYIYLGACIAFKQNFMDIANFLVDKILDPNLKTFIEDPGFDNSCKANLLLELTFRFGK